MGRCDVSKDTLHIAYPKEIDSKGQTQWSYYKLPNELAAIEQWASHLGADVQIVFEHTGTYSARLSWVLAMLKCPFSIIK